MSRNVALHSPLSQLSHALPATRRFVSRRLVMRTRLFARRALAAACLLSASSAHASGYLNPRLADPRGHPALSNPYAIYFNPAALGGMRGTNIVVDGTLAWRTADVTRFATALSPLLPGSPDDPTYVRSNTGDAHA